MNFNSLEHQSLEHWKKSQENFRKNFKSEFTKPISWKTGNNIFWKPLKKHKFGQTGTLTGSWNVIYESGS